MRPKEDPTSKNGSLTLSGRLGVKLEVQEYGEFLKERRKILGCPDCIFDNGPQELLGRIK